MPRDLEDLTGAEDVALPLRVGDLDAAAVEVLDDHAGEARQGLRQRDVDRGGQVGAGAAEDGVLGLDEVEDEVAGFLVGDLVGLAFEDDGVALPR